METYTCTITGDEEMGFDLIVTGTQYRFETLRSYFEANAARMVAGNVPESAPGRARDGLTVDAVRDLYGQLTIKNP